MPRSCYFSTTGPELSSEPHCVSRAPASVGMKGKVWLFLSGLSEKQKRDSPGRPVDARSSGSLCHFVIIFEDFAHRYFRVCVVKGAAAFHGEKGRLPSWHRTGALSVAGRQVHLRSRRWPGACSSEGSERWRRQRGVSASWFLSKLIPLTVVLIRILWLLHYVFCFSRFVDYFG